MGVIIIIPSVNYMIIYSQESIDAGLERPKPTIAFAPRQRHPRRANGDANVPAGFAGAFAAVRRRSSVWAVQARHRCFPVNIQSIHYLKYE